MDEQEVVEVKVIAEHMYERTFWQDHVTSPSNIYRMVDNGDGTYTITPASEVMQQGTPQDQLHFNNLEIGVVDAQLALQLLMNGARQNAWEIERGTVTLTNTATYPNNNSVRSVALDKIKENGDYVVLAEVVSFDGNVGEIVVSDKLTNGFKIGFSGSAKSATVNYTVIGGLLK